MEGPRPTKRSRREDTVGATDQNSAANLHSITLPEWAIPQELTAVAAATSFSEKALVTASNVEKAQLDASFTKKVAETAKDKTTELFLAAHAEGTNEYLAKCNISWPVRVDIAGASKEDPLIGIKVKQFIPKELMPYVNYDDSVFDDLGVLWIEMESENQGQTGSVAERQH